MRGTDLTTGSIWRHLIIFSIPMLFGSLMQTAYSVINAVWVGNGLGSESVAAIAVSFPVIFLLVAVVNGLSLGASVIVSQNYGAKNFSGLSKIVNNSFFVALSMSLFCMAAGYYFSEPLLKANGTPVEIIPLASSYLRLFIWTIPSMFGIFMVSACLRGTGDAKTPLYFQAVGLISTCVLDPLLMFGWLGFPRMNLNGAAAATIIVQTAVFLLLLLFLHRKKHLASPEMKGFIPDWEIIKQILLIGIPSVIQQGLVSIGMILLIGLVNGFGKNAVAAFGAALRFDQLAYMPAMTIGMAISTIAGQNLGAGLIPRVRQTFWVGIVLGVLSALPGTIIVSAKPEFILRMFLQEPEVISIGCHYFRIIAIGYIMFSIMFVGNGVINGSGKTFITTLISLIALWGIRLPLATYLSKTSMQLEGIWYAIVISAFIGMSLSLLYYGGGRWKNSAKCLKA
ncbi:MAG: MATE family efflux transporter [Candidatus Riflebacteria bacterium]|nr:MATE family efflux transporter [Candidatus Riflebacteria bacterium]